MYATERQDLIAHAVRESGRVSVKEIADRFEVTTETARRDLAALEEAGAVRRVHGGAVAPDRASLIEPALAERQALHGSEKQLVADRALRALPDGFTGSVLLDAGSTTGALVERLAARRGVQIVTNAVAHAAALAGREGIDLAILGGRVRSVTGAAVGPDAVAAIDAMRPDVAFVGANGISASFGISTPDPDEAAVKAAMVRAARRTIVVADASKFGAESLHRFAHLSDVDVIASDAGPAPELRETCSAAGVEVWDA